MTMPLPEPNAGEDESKFVSRCMANPHMNEKFPEQEQRAAVCYRQFRGNREMRPLLNREFKLADDGWFQIAPFGLWPHAATGTLQVLDERAVKMMVERFNSEAASANFGGLLVDFDHFSYDPDKPSEAAGWITNLDTRNDGLWGKVRWTDLGQRRVQNGEYRFISPVWLTTDGEPIGQDSFRPLRLDGAGLTNQPNLRGMVPLSNSRRPASADPADSEQRKERKSMKSVMTRLGLSADASEESAAQAVDTLTNRATTAEAGLAAKDKTIAEQTSEIAALKEENAKLKNTQVEQDLATYANRFAPEAKEVWRKSLLANREFAIALLNSIATPKGDTANVNRADGKNPTGSNSGAPSFPQLVEDEVKASGGKLSKAEACSIVANRNQEAHVAWLKAGGGKL